MTEYTWRSYSAGITIPDPGPRRSRYRSHWWQFWIPRKPFIFALMDKIAEYKGTEMLSLQNLYTAAIDSIDDASPE